MQPRKPAPSREIDLEERLRRAIVYRTWDRIRWLDVKVANGQVIVQGATTSYHVKQLALLAIREVMGTVPVALEIEVGSRPTFACTDPSISWSQP